MSAADATAPADQPTRSGRLLGLLRRLIDYGRNLAASLKEPDGTTDRTAVTRHFGVDDIGLILSRIVRGLFRANILEQRIIGCAARLDAKPKPRLAAVPRAPRTEAPAPPRAPRPVVAPTALSDEIAEAARRQRIGRVLADICDDLGIVPSHELWRELKMAISECGGSFVALVNDSFDRVLGPLPSLMRATIPEASSLPPTATAAATGPP